MSELKIWMSNIAYAKGFNGALAQHVLYAHRHFYCSPKIQRAVLQDIRTLLEREQPDVCCLVEIEKARRAAGSIDHLQTLLEGRYHYSDIANKYSAKGGLQRLPGAASKCNAFFANRDFPFERIYLRTGHKRLVYKISLTPNVTLFFAHFSLRKVKREAQFRELHAVLTQTPGQHIVMGDFNILTGFQELGPLLDGTDLVLRNNPHETTFRFHQKRQVLDLCLCSRSLVDNTRLKVIDQPYSDHAALLLHVQGLSGIPARDPTAEKHLPPIETLPLPVSG